MIGTTVFLMTKMSFEWEKKSKNDFKRAVSVHIPVHAVKNTVSHFLFSR